MTEEPVWHSDTHLILKTGKKAYQVYKRIGTSGQWQRQPEGDRKIVWYKTLEAAIKSIDPSEDKGEEATMERDGVWEDTNPHDSYEKVTVYADGAIVARWYDEDGTVNSISTISNEIGKQILEAARREAVREAIAKIGDVVDRNVRYQQDGGDAYINRSGIIAIQDYIRWLYGLDGEEK